MIGAIILALGFGVAIGILVARNIPQSRRGALSSRAAWPEPAVPWPEEPQKAYRCSHPRCGRPIVKDREGDVFWTRIHAGQLERYHARCWDSASNQPRS